MKSLKLLFIAIFLFSCTNQQKSRANTDSIGDQSEEEFRDSAMAAMKEDSNNRIFGDTVGSYKSPIRVLSSKVVKAEYSSYRNVELTFKNYSDKKVTGIKFRWYGVNAFNEPADLGNDLFEGYGDGFTDKEIKPGKTSTLTWEANSRRAKKILKAWAYEVAFNDGTSWKKE
nr:hypothetical protein [Pseudopedobacter sp.]